MEENIEELRRMYLNSLVLFRGIENYYFYGEDAKEASEILGTTLTKSKGMFQTVIPKKLLNLYIYRLIKAGKRVVCCQIYPQKYSHL